VIRSNSIWSRFKAFPFCYSVFVFKIIAKLNTLGGKRDILDRLFFSSFFCLKFMYLSPVWQLLRSLILLFPLVGYRKRMRFGKHLKSKLSKGALSSEFFIKDRRTRKKDKNKVSATKKQIKSTGRDRRYVAPIKHIFVMPWMYSKYQRIFIAYKWLISNLKSTFLGIPKTRNSVFLVLKENLLGFKDSLRIKGLLSVKRRMYSILYKTRVGLHFRW